MGREDEVELMEVRKDFEDVDGRMNENFESSRKIFIRGKKTLAYFQGSLLT